MLRELLILTLMGVALGAPSPKIEAALQSKSSAAITVSFIHSTDSIFENISLMPFATRAAKISSMKFHLQQLKEASQRNLINFLETRHIPFKSFWVNNHLYLNEASAELIEQIAKFPEVAAITEQGIVQLQKPGKPFQVDNSFLSEWNLQKIEVEQAWALPGGNNGTGSVIGLVDSGVRGSHSALKNNFRSQNGWHDARPDEEEVSDVPTDGYGSGTHSLGLIAGSNGIGVAPGAEWIACRATDDSGIGYLSSFIECGEWMVCPNGACDQAPNLVANPWAMLVGWESLHGLVLAWRLAGIIPIAAIGDHGPFCSYPQHPGSFEGVIGVGSTNNKDDISIFSSRGPTADARIKPDITAPGTQVRSADYTSDTAYSLKSSTENSVGQVAGVVALLTARNPNFSYDQIKNFLQDNADKKLDNQSRPCGGVPSNQFPNNVYGHGRVNARASLAAAINSA